MRRKLLNEKRIFFFGLLSLVRCQTASGFRDCDPIVNKKKKKKKQKKHSWSKLLEEWKAPVPGKTLKYLVLQKRQCSHNKFKVFPLSLQLPYFFFAVLSLKASLSLPSTISLGSCINVFL
jgi:hypothetical protein